MQFEHSAALRTVMASDLNPAAKLVFWAVLDDFGRKDYSWPGVRRLLRKTNLGSFTTIQGAVAALISGGFLVVEERPRGGRSYRLGATATVALQPVERKRYSHCSASATATVAESLLSSGTNRGNPPNPPSLNGAKGGTGRAPFRSQKRQRRAQEEADRLAAEASARDVRRAAAAQARAERDRAAVPGVVLKSRVGEILAALDRTRRSINHSEICDFPVDMPDRPR